MINQNQTSYNIRYQTTFGEFQPPFTTEKKAWAVAYVLEYSRSTYCFTGVVDNTLINLMID
jgi:hypothetical protein